MTNKNSNTRLRLDFSLVYDWQRRDFIAKYLTSETFARKGPTPDELEMMGNYILWGVSTTESNNASPTENSNAASTTNGVNETTQNDGFALSTSNNTPISANAIDNVDVFPEKKSYKRSMYGLRSKNETWDESPVQSLEQIMEQPSFNEAYLSPISTGNTRYLVRKEKFSREAALSEAPEHLKQDFARLFEEIDRTDLYIELYEELHGRRTKPIRPSLLSKFSSVDVLEMREKVTHWNQHNYLKHRHYLVELRREQYTLRDSYKQAILPVLPEDFVAPPPIDFDAGISVLPLSLNPANSPNASPALLAIFQPFSHLNPENVPEELLPEISRIYWEKKNFAPTGTQQYFDFRDEGHIYHLLDLLNEMTSITLVIQDEEKDADVDDGRTLREHQDFISSNTPMLVQTLAYYIAQADLSDTQREILSLKLQHKKNSDIADIVNNKYSKSYTPNYISTIFRQRIIPKIAEAANYHEKVISNIFFPEEFKQCTLCGEVKLRDPINFTRKSRSSDGLSPRCKKCEKKIRQGGTNRNE